MSRYFITGSGTGVGKTLLTCALVHQLRKEGRAARAIKPVISGFDADRSAESDTGMLLAAQGLALTQPSIEAVSPWRFAAPISPDMAAQDEGGAVEVDRLVSFCRAQEGAGLLLVEGVGGVMVPLNATHTVLDWMGALGYPVILAAGSYLGSLSHTLLSARAIISAGLRLHAVVVSASESSPVAMQRTEATLRRFLPRNSLLASIARLDSCPELWKYVPNLTQRMAL